jgi:hypothetical protein
VRVFRTFEKFNLELRKSGSEGITHIAFVVAFIFVATAMTYAYSSMGSQIAKVLFKDLKASTQNRLSYNVGVQVAPTVLPSMCSNGSHTPTPSSWTCGNNGGYTFSCNCSLAQQLDAVGNTIASPGGKFAMNIAMLSGTQTLTQTNLVWDPTVYSYYETHGVNWNDYIVYSDITKDAYNQPEVACLPNYAEADGSITITGPNSAYAGTLTGNVATAWTGTSAVPAYNRCIHAGELRKFIFDRTSVPTCAGLNLADTTGVAGAASAFNWACTTKDANGNDLTDVTGRKITKIYSTGLADGMGLSDLISAQLTKASGLSATSSTVTKYKSCTAQFIKRQLVVSNISGGPNASINTTLSSWWRNPIVCLNTSTYLNYSSAPMDLPNAGPSPTGADLWGTIYVLAQSAPTNGYRMTGDKEAFVTLKAQNVTVNGVQATTDAVLRLGNSSFYNFGNLYQSGAEVASPVGFNNSYSGTAVLAGGDLKFGAPNNLASASEINMLHFAWVEGRFLGDGTGSGNQTSHTLAFPEVYMSRFNNINAINGNHICVMLGSGSGSGSRDVVSYLNAEGCGMGLGESIASSLFHDITVSNNQNHLAREDGAVQFGGNYVTAYNINANNNPHTDGLIIQSYNSSFYNIVSTFNGSAGIRVFNTDATPLHDTIVRATLAYNGAEGIVYSDATYTTAFQILSYGNQLDGFGLSGAQNNFIGQSASVNNARMGVSEYYTSMNGLYGVPEVPLQGTQQNTFSGNLVLGGNSKDCLFTDSLAATITVVGGNYSLPGLPLHGGLISSGSTLDAHTGLAYTCQGQDYTAVSSALSITSRGSTKLTSNFLGIVSAGDLANPVAKTSGTQSYASIGPYSSGGVNLIPSSSGWDTTTDKYIGNWFSFTALPSLHEGLRSWGNTSATASDCSSGNCGLWDFSLSKTSDLLLGYAVNGGTVALPPTPASSPCPNYLDGSRPANVLSDGTHTFLKNAVEIMGSGNFNGLCEAGESCLYTPNFGSYQGDSGNNGSLHSCTYTGSSSGVAATDPRTGSPTTIYYYTNNGN